MTPGIPPVCEPDPFDLERFVEAQRDTYAVALHELALGRKQSHWMWFVFLQFAGLGSSPTSRHYAIRTLDEAAAYLRHPVLGPRLEACTRTLNDLRGRTALEVFGSVDARKFRSSMTLFELAVGGASAFSVALERYCHGERDRETVRLVRSA